MFDVIKVHLSLCTYFSIFITVMEKTDVMYLSLVKKPFITALRLLRHFLRFKKKKFQTQEIHLIGVSTQCFLPSPFLPQQPLFLR